MADYRCYLTNAGIAAENNARNNGTTFKITEMVFDGAYLSDELNPESLTDVIQPELSLPCTTSLSDDGQTLTVKSAIVVPEGDFRVWGIGLKTSDGVLYAYARSKGDQILHEYEGVVESIRYALDVITQNADVIEINVDGSTVYADLEHVDNQILEHENKSDPHVQYLKEDEFNEFKLSNLEYVGDRVNQIIDMMRKMEGKLGRVRIYMANDIDDDYLPILGQTLLKTEYPDYFAHLGIVADQLMLPDWSQHPYLHQSSDAIPAGTTLEQQILRHIHGASSGLAGEHIHDVDDTDLGTKYTDYTNAHRHEYDKLQNGTELFVENNGGGGKYGKALTEEEPAHRHAVVMGKHKHNMQSSGAHEHDITIDETGADLLRPNSTAVVFAVKVKYLVNDIVA